MISRNARIGLILFGVYCSVYAAFVLLNAFVPTFMDSTPVAGLNMAILYGFFLIAFALGLSGLYGMLCRSDSGSPKGSESGEEASA